MLEVWPFNCMLFRKIQVHSHLNVTIPVFDMDSVWQGLWISKAVQIYPLKHIYLKRKQMADSSPTIQSSTSCFLQKETWVALMMSHLAHICLLLDFFAVHFPHLFLPQGEGFLITQHKKPTSEWVEVDDRGERFDRSTRGKAFAPQMKLKNHMVGSRDFSIKSAQSNNIFSRGVWFSFSFVRLISWCVVFHGVFER